MGKGDGGGGGKCSCSEGPAVFPQQPPCFVFFLGAVAGNLFVFPFHVFGGEGRWERDERGRGELPAPPPNPYPFPPHIPPKGSTCSHKFFVTYWRNFHIQNLVCLVTCVSIHNKIIGDNLRYVIIK